MKRLGKKIASAALALTLTVSMASTAFGATWGSYFGGNEGWEEGSFGTLKSESAKGFVAQLDMINYGGIWGAQVKQKVNIKKNDTFRVKFSIKGTDIKKWVYVKFAKVNEAEGIDSTAGAFWVRTVPGQVTKIDKVFKSAGIADQVTFGLGGEFGDREGVSTESDATYRYGLFPNFADVEWDEDPNTSTTITVSDYKYGLVPKAVSNKKTNFKNLAKYLKAAGSFTAKKKGYKVTFKASGSKVSILAKKGSKKVANFKVKSSQLKKFKKKFAKGKAKKSRTAVDKVLKSYSGLTLKNIGLK